jgi:Polyketide cyclase / dehydrase and lipid transport
MQPYQVAMSSLIKAPASQLYAIIADYHNGHPQIRPKQYFTKLTVEQGGSGAGTHIRFEMNALGRKQSFRGLVSEPEPGRVLVETNQADNLPPSVTTFTVEPVAGGTQAQVTIHTLGQTRDGLGGQLEALVSKLFLRRVYQQELALLAAYAAGQAA